MIKTIFTFLKIAIKTKPSHFIYVVLRSLLDTAVVTFSMYSVKLIMDYLVNKSYQETIYLIIMICTIHLLKYLLDRSIIRILNVSDETLRQGINHVMAKKLTNLDYQKLEDPYYLDLKERAKFALDNQGALYSLIETISTTISALTTMIGLLVIVALFDPLLLLVVVASLIIYMITTRLTLKTQLNFYNEIIPINRKFGYYINELMDYQNAKEYRFSKIDQLLEQKEKEFIVDTNKFFRKFSFKHTFFSAFLSALSYAQQGFTYGYIAYQTLIRSLQLGDFTFYTSAVLKLTTSTNSLIDMYINFKRLSSYIEPFIMLIKLPESEMEGTLPISQLDTIEFKNVTFKYPKTETEILKNVSFKVNKGEKISIVGFNGAGKTTLVKLLTRLYEPQSGQILVNDIDIKDYDYKQYMRLISAVFQDFSLFAYSIMENVSSGDNNREKTINVLEKSGIPEIVQLKDGIDTMMTKAYHKDGVELSGGQMQKLSIARALYKDSQLVILDEPTSALDPLSEAKIYEHFNELVADKTAFYISHRMSSSIFCDKVLVLNEGKVESFDAHKNLLKQKESLYYRLFTTQAKNYQE